MLASHQSPAVNGLTNGCPNHPGRRPRNGPGRPKVQREAENWRTTGRNGLKPSVSAPMLGHLCPMGRIQADPRDAEESTASGNEARDSSMQAPVSGKLSCLFAGCATVICPNFGGREALSGASSPPLAGWGTAIMRTDHSPRSLLCSWESGVGFGRAGPKGELGRRIRVRRCVSRALGDFGMGGEVSETIRDHAGGEPGPCERRPDSEGFRLHAPSTRRWIL